MIFRRAALITALFFLLPWKIQAENPFGLSDKLHDQLIQALEANYRLEYDTAIEHFKTLEDENPGHPIIPFGETLILWWQLSVNALEFDLEKSQPFLASAERVLELAEDLIDEGDPTGEGHLIKGATLGLLGRWHVGVGNYVRAYFKGKKAYAFLEQGHEINPAMRDVYLGMGLYEYTVATLPSVVRVLGIMGIQGDAEKGLEQIRMAAEDSVFSEDAAWFTLAKMYITDEKTPEKSLPILKKLKKRYPDSPYLYSLYLLAYYNSGHVEKLKSMMREFESKIHAGKIPLEYAAQNSFQHGAAALIEKKWDVAATHFQKATEFQTETDPYQHWARLYYGVTLDAQGNRDTAKETYRMVLKELERWTSHDLARDYLDEPFTGSEEDLAELRL